MCKIIKKLKNNQIVFFGIVQDTRKVLVGISIGLNPQQQIERK